MAVVDFSGLAYFLPLWSFVIVSIVVFAVLHKTKILGENKLIQGIISFVIATVFVTTIGARDYVLSIVPWFAVLVVAIFFIFVITGFIGIGSKINNGIGIVFVIILGLILLFSAISVFSWGAYLPGSSGGAGNENLLQFTDWLYSPKVAGAILLIGLSVVLSWILIKMK